MLSESALNHILSRVPGLTIGVIGDLFLDRYLDIDAEWTEPSLETGLDAYQVRRVRTSPGAAGTVINNLTALGVRSVIAIAIIGDDGEGYELRQALNSQKIVDTRWVFPWESRRTPTYTKPMLHEAGKPVRELNRLDIKNRSQMPAAAEDSIFKALSEVWPQVDCLVVLDQVSEADCGVITTRVRQRLSEMGAGMPEKLILADSRERVGLFKAMWLKPNEAECIRAVAPGSQESESAEKCLPVLARRVGRPVFCTCGDKGILLLDPRPTTWQATRVPAYPVTGPVDVVGAGDSTSARTPELRRRGDRSNELSGLPRAGAGCLFSRGGCGPEFRLGGNGTGGLSEGAGDGP